MAIQVLERSFRILEELALDGEVSLETLSRTGSLNKGTLCNILKTLIVLGYVEKRGRGSYVLSERFRTLCSGTAWGEAQYTIMRRAAETLAEELEESIVISTIRDRRVAIIAQSQHQRHLMINQVIYYARLSLYHSVSGRIVFAFLPAERRRELWEGCGAPGAEWDGIADRETLEQAAAEIRDRGVSVMTNPGEGIKSFAVPVFDGRGEICVSLALTMPISRLEADGGARLVRRLRKKAEQISGELTARSLDAGTFFRPF